MPDGSEPVEVTGDQGDGLTLLEGLGAFALGLYVMGVLWGGRHGPGS